MKSRKSKSRARLSRGESSVSSGPDGERRNHGVGLAFSAISSRKIFIIGKEIHATVSAHLCRDIGPAVTADMELEPGAGIPHSRPRRSHAALP
jgi:hypothetical protein